jgi:dipeptidase
VQIINEDMMRKMLFSLLILGFFAGQIQTAKACTNFLVTKGASKDGSTMISYAADSHVLYGELYYTPAMDYEEGSMLKIYEWDTGKYLGEITQVLHTYSVVGNVNENQVAIGETTYTGRSELGGSNGIVDYGSLIYLGLQRSKNARDAIKIMTEYTEKMEKLFDKKSVFYVLAEPQDFSDKDERLDPILLVQSPFGFYYQILGAWDKEMLLLSEL